MNRLKHPFNQVLLVLVVSFVLIKWGIALIPPLLGFESAPVPASVVFQYMVTALVGVLLWVSDNEARWTEFKEPINRTLVRPERKLARGVLMVAIPLLVGFVTFGRVKPSVSAPPNLRSIHPAPPGKIDFQGRQITLTGLENPLRSRGNLEDHYEEGKRVYYQNCLACHGDRLDGLGHYAGGFSPAPLPFMGTGTIVQLTESFVFWRVAKGGIGLPSEGTPWNSAMPAWEDFLTEDEIWSVIIFLYEQTGLDPRTWEESGEGEGQ